MIFALGFVQFLTLPIPDIALFLAVIHSKDGHTNAMAPGALMWPAPFLSQNQQGQSFENSITACEVILVIAETLRDFVPTEGILIAASWPWWAPSQPEVAQQMMKLAMVLAEYVLQLLWPILASDAAELYASR